MGEADTGIIQESLTWNPGCDTSSITFRREEIPDNVWNEIENMVAALRGIEDSSSAEARFREIEPALENMDGRRDHERLMDAGIQISRNLVKEKKIPYDVILTEVEYDLNHLRDDIEDLLGYEPEDRFLQGEIDLLLVDSETNWMEGIEFKPRRGSMVRHDGEWNRKAPTHRSKASRQSDRRVEQMDVLSEVVDEFDFVYREGYPVFESDLNPYSEMPDHWDGSHYNGEKLKDLARTDESVRAFLENIVLPENPGILSEGEEFTRRRDGKGEFVRNKMEELYGSY